MAICKVNLDEKHWHKSVLGWSIWFIFLKLKAKNRTYWVEITIFFYLCRIIDTFDWIISFTTVICNYVVLSHFIDINILDKKNCNKRLYVYVSKFERRFWTMMQLQTLVFILKVSSIKNKTLTFIVWQSTKYKVNRFWSTTCMIALDIRTLI